MICCGLGRVNSKQVLICGLESTEFSPDGRRIVTASGDYTGRMWDLIAGNAGQHLNDRDVFEALKDDAAETQKQLKEQLNYESTENDWLTWDSGSLRIARREQYRPFQNHGPGIHRESDS